jgi:hypothetical protein
MTVNASFLPWLPLWAWAWLLAGAVVLYRLNRRRRSAWYHAASHRKLNSSLGAVLLIAGTLTVSAAWNRGDNAKRQVPSTTPAKASVKQSARKESKPSPQSVPTYDGANVQFASWVQSYSNVVAEHQIQAARKAREAAAQKLAAENKAKAERAARAKLAAHRAAQARRHRAALIKARKARAAKHRQEVLVAKKLAAAKRRAAKPKTHAKDKVVITHQVPAPAPKPAPQPVIRSAPAQKPKSKLVVTSPPQKVSLPPLQKPKPVMKPVHKPATRLVTVPAVPSAPKPSTTPTTTTP